MNRALVIALPALWLAMAVVAHRGGNLWWLYLLAAVQVVVILALFTRTRSVANLLDRYADEFQRHRRDRAHRLAYWGLSFPTGLAAGWCTGRMTREYEVGADLVISVDSLPLLGVVMFGVLVVWTALPSAILALTEPLPLNDESEVSPR